MKKLKIFIYHLLVFIVGSVGLIAYVFIHLSSLKGEAAIGGIIVMPVITLLYVTIFGILCLISMLIWFLVVYFRNRKD